MNMVPIAIVGSKSKAEFLAEYAPASKLFF